MAHELAMARRVYNASGQRQSRFTAWSQHQQKVIDFLQDAPASADLGAKLPLTYRPRTVVEGTPSYQLVVFQLSAGGPCAVVVGVVLSVFRGAVCSRKDLKGPSCRSMRATKLSCGPLPAAVCASIRVAHLRPSGDNSFTATCFSTCSLLDPVVSVLYEVAPVTMTETRTKLTVVLPGAAVAALASLASEDTPAFVDLAAPSQSAPPTPGPSVPKKPAVQAFSELSFGKTKGGDANIAAYFHQLERLFSEVYQRELVDGDGLVQMETRGPKHRWHEIVAQAPLYFRTVYAKEPLYHRLVFNDLLRAAPNPGRNAEGLGRLIRRIARDAPPVLPTATMAVQTSG